MNGDVYIFGSTVRGEIQNNSDIDVLAIPSNINEREIFPNFWSVYSRETIRNYFEEGRLFAWHLHLEAKCVFSDSETPFLLSLGAPRPYITFIEDISNLEMLFNDSILELENDSPNLIYELGIVYTALRDIAMVASSRLLKQPCFSRNSPYLLPIEFPVPNEIYMCAMEARLLSTRAISSDVNFKKIKESIILLPIKSWINAIKESL
ncbi:nucleotidyltransferase domain-containing protein [Undibacterium sp. Xuan67W]|uniref:nucleotidyltransferase domain-containing protein n=1 Tax=Undibacterium sp. Xuan67W TaxID=3413057 RepID=UPI003BEF4F0B